MSVTIGIDPGLHGAIALLGHYGDLLDVHDMPLVGNLISAHLLADLEDWRNDGTSGHRLGPFGTAVVEDVHSMPKQGVASSFGFGRSKGVAEGVFAGAGRPVVYVSPTRWKKDLRLTSDKETSRRRAIETWPAKAHLFTRKMDADRAEAALIALWHQQFGLTG